MTDRTYNELTEATVNAEAMLAKALAFIDMLRNVWIVDGYVVGFDYGMFLQRGAMDKATLGRLTEAKIFLSLHAARAARVENGKGELARVIGHETAVNMVIRQQEELCEFLRNAIMECGVEMALIRTEWQDRYCREDIERDADGERVRHGTWSLRFAAARIADSSSEYEG